MPSKYCRVEFAEDLRRVRSLVIKATRVGGSFQQIEIGLWANKAEAGIRISAVKSYAGHEI